MVDEELHIAPNTLTSFDPTSFLLVPAKRFEDLRVGDIFGRPAVH